MPRRYPPSRLTPMGTPRFSQRRAASLQRPRGLHFRGARYAHGGDRGRLSIRSLVGEVPSNASALPNQCRVVILRSPFPLMSMWAQMMVGGIPRNADCRGGVFATRRFPRPPPTPAMRIPPPGATHSMRIPATPPIAATIPAPSPYHRRTNQRPSPYQPETIVASCSDFALRRNPNMKRRWYGDGTTMVRRISGDAPWLGAKVGAAVPCVTGRSGDTGDPAFAEVAEKTPVMRAVFFVTTSSTPPFSI